MDMGALIGILPKLTPQKIEKLKFIIKDPRDLTKATNISEESVKLCIHGMLLGPRDLDVYLLHYALTNPSSKFFGSSFPRAWMLSLVLLDRKDGDIEAITARYRELHNDDVLKPLKKALKGKNNEPLGTLYMNALENRRNPGTSEVPEAMKLDTQKDIERQAGELYSSGVGEFEPNTASWIFATSTPERLKEIMAAFNKERGQSLIAFIKEKGKKKEGVRDQLLYILEGIENRAKRDAELLEDSMKGIGKSSERDVRAGR
jgi:annexin A7/11